MKMMPRTEVARDAFARAERQEDHYVVRVNKNRLDVERMTDELNRRYNEGWNLRFCFQQDGNTVQIYERLALDTTREERG